MTPTIIRFATKGKESATVTTVLHPRGITANFQVYRFHENGRCSYVRGEANKASDVDILVELDYSQRIGLLFIQMQLDLEELLHQKVDLVSANGVSKYLKPIIDREKELIYAR